MAKSKFKYKVGDVLGSFNHENDKWSHILCVRGYSSEGYATAHVAFMLHSSTNAQGHGWEASDNDLTDEQLDKNAYVKLLWTQTQFDALLSLYIRD